MEMGIPVKLKVQNKGQFVKRQLAEMKRMNKKMCDVWFSPVTGELYKTDGVIEESLLLGVAPDWYPRYDSTTDEYIGDTEEDKDRSKEEAVSFWGN